MKAKRISAIVLALAMALSTLNFSVFAEEITESSVAKIGDVEYVDLHKAMVACNAGETVVLISDVELAGTTWEPVSFKGTFDGQNYTVSNLTINKPGVSNTGFITSLNGTFKNVTFTNPTVTGGECTGVLAGRAGSSAALAENITVNGTIKVETTHSGYARAGVIVGGWAYGNYKKITVDGGDKAVSYIKHTGGGDGRYVAGIVGHADDVESYVNCAVKNITISGGWLCGGIAGPGPSDGLAEGCSVENIDMGADYSGGMFGWYYGSGTIKNSSVKNVAFTDGTSNNGAIGGYSANTDATVTNVTIENVTNGDKTLLDHVAELNGTYYFTLAEAVAEATSGDTITLLADTTISENVTLPAGIIFNGNGKKISRENSAIVYAGGDLTFEGYTTIANFNAYGNTITIGEGATLETTDGRMVIGHGATFNITGSITDAKSADTANITPSFIAPGASLTGAGVTFNITNAYVKFTDYCSSKNNNASGTYSINVTNSIWEQAGSLVFSEPTNGMDPTFNFNIKDSVLNSTSHLVFAVTKGDIVFDNSLVNKDAYRQLENRSNLTIKNGSVVYASVQTSSNAKNPGTTTVDNSTYVTTGTFGGADVGTGTLILKNGASFTTGSLSKVNATVDATSLLIATKVADTSSTTITVDGSALEVGEEVKVIDLSGNVSIEDIVTVSGEGVAATYGEDGDVTIIKQEIPVAEVNGTEYTDIQEAIKAATPSGTVNILTDVTVDTWIMFSQTKTIGNGNIITLEMDGLTINGNGHSLTVNNVESAKNGGYLFDDAAELNISNLTINMPEGADMGGIHLESGVINNVTFNNGNCIFPGQGDITVTGCTFNTDGHVIYYEAARDNLKVTDNTFNVDPSGNIIIMYGNEIFSGNKVNSGRTVNVASGSPTVSDNIFADGVRLKVYNTATATITGNTLDYIVFNDETPVQSSFENNILSENAEQTLKDAGVIKIAAKIGDTEYTSLADAVSAANDGETITLLAECSNVDLTVNNAVTIDLGGKTITDAYIIIKKAVEIKNGDIVNTNEPYPLVVKGGHLTVNDVDIAASKSDRAIWLDSGTLDFNSGSILATKGEGNNKSSIAAIWVSSGQVNINGGTLTVDTPGADAIGVYGNYANAHVTMNDGKISTSGDSYSYGIRVDGDITVTGGEIVTNEKGYGYSSGIRYGNNYALYTCLGDVTITGGKITTNGYSGYMVNVGRTYSSVDQTVVISDVEFTNNLNEVEKTQGGHKAPVLVWEGSSSNVTATITSGTFNGVSSTLLRGDNTTLTVSGGIFENAPDEKYLAEGFTLKENADGAYEVLPKETKVAKIGDDEYFTLQDAINEANDGDTITLISGDIPISAAGAVYGKNITITGDAVFDWSQGWLFVGRGGEGDATLTFDKANITSTEASLANGSYGIHVSAPEKDSTTKNKGTVIFKDSDVQLSYLANRGNVTVDNSKLYVHYGFAVHGRPAAETPDGTAGTAEMNIINGSAVTVNIHNGMGIGLESKGVLNVTDSAFEYKNSDAFLVYEGSEVNLTNAEFIAPALTTNKNFFINGECTVKVNDLQGRATVNDKAVLKDSYINSTKNGTTRIMGDLTINGDFSAAYLMTDTSGYTGTVTIDENATVKATYGVEINGNATLNGGTIELSGGNSSGSIWGFVFQDGTPVINSDIVVNGLVNGSSKTAPVHFTNITDGVVNGSLTHSNSGGEPIYISEASTVTFSASSDITAKTSVHVIGTLKSSGNVTGTITKVKDTSVIEISGGTYTQNVTDWCIEGYEATDNGNGTYTVSKKPVPPEAEEEKTLNTRGYSIKNMDPVIGTDDEGNKIITKYKITMLAGIDSLDYNEVGFDVTFNNETRSFGTTTVYEKVKVKESGEIKEYFPSDFDYKVSGFNNYIIAYILELPASANGKVIYYTPYAIDFNDNKIPGATYKIDDIYTLD